MPADIPLITRRQPPSLLAATLAALVLLLASLLQWSAGAAPHEAGAAGMAAPVPVPLSWEAAKPLTLGGDSGAWRLVGGSSLLRSLHFGRRSTPAPLFAKTSPVSEDRRSRLLLTGNLLLEGG